MTNITPIHIVTDSHSNSNVDAKAAVEALGRQDTIAEASAPKAPPSAAAAPDSKKKRRHLGLKRPILFGLLPVVLVMGAYYYVTGGAVMSTDNAYIEADMVGLTTDVSGIVDNIAVHENETVKAGEVLFNLRTDSFKIAFNGAAAQLGAVRNQILNLQASYQQSLVEITQAEADIPYYQSQLVRQQSLLNSAAASRAAFDEAKHNLDAGNQKVDVAKAQAATTLAQLGGDANQLVELNPLYLQQKANVDNAQRELDHSVVMAPMDGIVTNVNSLQVGSYLAASTQAFSLVSSSHLWIAAQPKETELTHLRPGQNVSISVDTYPGIIWKGKIESIGPASGSTFSLLPAQNTTGNWVKVVQRIPMRVAVDDIRGKPPLRVGMSTVVDVETGHARGLPDFFNRLLGRPIDNDYE